MSQNQQNLPAEQQQKTKVASERFTSLIIKEFQSLAGQGVQFSPEQKRLAQHLFVKIDAALKEADARRQGNAPAVTWENVNLQKLATDAIHRIELGLDALIENHIYPIAYLNGKTGKYDVDLRIGYTGKLYYRRKFAIDPPSDIRLELVYENDKLTVVKQDMNSEVEGYTFEIPKPLDRGKVIGGFGYLSYKDKSKNKLILVSNEDILKREAKAQSKVFWGGWRQEMEFKTLVNIVTNGRNMPIDPEKVSVSYFKVEHDENAEDQPEQDDIVIEAEPAEETKQIEQPKQKPETGKPENHDPEQKQKPDSQNQDNDY